jgi:hypothetical protein
MLFEVSKWTIQPAVPLSSTMVCNLRSPANCCINRGSTRHPDLTAPGRESTWHAKEQQPRTHGLRPRLKHSDLRPPPHQAARRKLQPQQPPSLPVIADLPSPPRPSSATSQPAAAEPAIVWHVSPQP